MCNSVYFPRKSTLNNDFTNCESQFKVFKLGEIALISVVYICIRMTSDTEKQGFLYFELKNYFETINNENDEKSFSDSVEDEQQYIIYLLFKCIIPYSIDENEKPLQIINIIDSFLSKYENIFQNDSNSSNQLFNNVSRIHKCIQAMIKNEVKDITTSKEIISRYMEQYPESCGWIHFTLCQCLKSESDFILFTIYIYRLMLSILHGVH
eukprot:gb/GECH01002707.1/.p1 GENE.gb/GECH01002707.1/~~gb/GECH01002707.1/.p1  ORF type:complete len:209 (+),score=27.22 gb/GECH01002707.1/:1-627(+)